MRAGGILLGRLCSGLLTREDENFLRLSLLQAHKSGGYAECPYGNSASEIYESRLFHDGEGLDLAVPSLRGGVTAKSTQGINAMS